MAREPLYKKAEIEMIRRIRSGEWAPGLRLPNEFGLADEFGVSQGTMRRALMTLEGMGLLSRKPGRGTLVADPTDAAPEQAGLAAAGFARLVDPHGKPTMFEVFRARATTRGATEAEAAIFGTGRLSVLERTLKSGGARAALEETVISEAAVAALPEDAPVMLSDLLAALNLPFATLHDQISAGVTSMGDSVALSTDRYAGLLVLVRTAHDAAGAAVARQTLRIASGEVSYGITLAP